MPRFPVPRGPAAEALPLLLLTVQGPSLRPILAASCSPPVACVVHDARCPAACVKFQ